MKKLYLSTFIAILCTPWAFAQESNLTGIPLGYIVRQAEFKITDMYQLSRFDTGLGTARSAAMAGAFASLGADLSSMSVNPAGLGMYRTSEFGITAGPMITGMKNSVPGAFSTYASRTSFGVNNVAVAFNIFESAGRLTSFTMGFGYNKLADFNHRSRVDYAASNSTILDMFAPIATNYAADVGHDVLDRDVPFDLRDSRSAFLDEWGAVLAYQAGLLRRDGDIYTIPGVTAEASIGQYLETVSRGSVGEYTFAGGWNFSNKFYVGFSFGFLEYYRNRDVTFREEYSDNTPLPPNDPVERMTYTQNIRTTGEGYNLKLGMIYRPVEELRIGLAVHSPTVVRLNTRYDSRMSATFDGGGTRTAQSPIGRTGFNEKFYTPTRILAGVSYTFANRGVLALDYEYTWYDGMRVWSDLYDEDGEKIKEQIKNDVKKDFTGAHTVRLGGEIMAADDLSVRLGASYVHDGLADAVRNGDRWFDVPLEKSSVTVSAGLGYRFTRQVSLDLAYAYSATAYTIYDIYYFEPGDGTLITMSDPVKMTRNRHNVMLSFNYKF